MHKTFYTFLDNIKANMLSKGSSNEQIVHYLSLVGEKYKSSPIFEDLNLDEFDDDMEEYMGTCFGNNASLDVINQMNSVVEEEDYNVRALKIIELQEYYRDKNFFPPEDMESEREVDDRGAFGRTQLHEAVLRQDKDRIIELLDEGASTDIADNNGLTPYKTAILENYVEITELFKSRNIGE